MSNQLVKFRGVRKDRIKFGPLLELHALMTIMHQHDKEAVGLNMFDWVRSGDVLADEPAPLTFENAFEHKCGTSACAVGFATLALPSWKKIFFIDAWDDLVVRGLPYCDADYVYDAVGKKLGIGIEAAQQLFAPDRCFYTYGKDEPNYRDIAKGIERLVKEALA
jgi:hypothetical protein